MLRALITLQGDHVISDSNAKSLDAAVISLDFSSVATWPSNSAAQACTMCNG